MNTPTTNGTATQTVVTVNGKPVTHIAVEAGDEIEKRACGRIVFWTCNGNVTNDALAASLIAKGSAAVPPEPPSALDALHRAASAVAKIVKGEAHHVSRGRWAVTTRTSEVVEREGEDGVQSDAAALAEQLAPKLKQLIYDIDVVGAVDKEGNLSVEGTKGAAELRTAFEAAKEALAPSDVSAWLKDEALRLGAVRLRDRGGVYFLPRPSVAAWDRLVDALGACSKHKAHTIPAMRSADAVEAILTAVADDTRRACDKMAAEIADDKMGSRALKNREEATAALLARVEQYETLLGTKLDDLRTAIDETRAAIATAAIAAMSNDDETQA